MIGALVVALAIMVGGTYAQFTDRAKITNHLQSGDMQLTLKRIDYTHMMLDDDGFVADVTPDGHDVVKDFSKEETNDNLFDLDNADRFVPGASVSAKLVLSNEKANSVAAFNYWFTVKLAVAEGETLAALAEYLLLDVKFENHSEWNVSNIKLSGDDKAHFDAETGEITIGTSQKPIGVLGVGASQTFTVTISMDKNAPNGEGGVSNQAISFDLVVHADQQITKPNA